MEGMLADVCAVLRRVKGIRISDIQKGIRISDIQKGIRISDIQKGIRISDIQKGIIISDLQKAIIISDLQVNNLIFLDHRVGYFSNSPCQHFYTNTYPLSQHFYTDIYRANILK
ncbi:hypothetical protein BsWGS_18395 [Bradybaena similaris]